jgi:hypothetical protein
VTVRVANNTVGCLGVTVHRPDDMIVASMSPCGATGNVSLTPSSTGTYTVKVNPTNANIGSLNLSVTNP